jgi:hypothetical protein
MVGDGLTCLTFGACTTQGTHFTPKVGRIVEKVQDSGMVSHVSFGACTRNTFTPRWNG